MPAKSKPELLEATQKEFVKLERLIGDISAKTALMKDDETISIKDIIGHRAHWINLFLGWYNDGQAGRSVSFPAKGYKWNELKRYNAQIRADQANMEWDEVCMLLRANYQALIKLIESHSDEALYGGPMPGANNHWTTGRWAEASGASHFRTAAKYIRARLKAYQF